MACWLKQSTAVDIGFGPFLDSTDGNTTETALTITQPDIRLKKNGGAWAQKSAAQTLTHEEAGWYEISLSTTDTDTLGILIVAVHESGALPVWREFNVVPANVWDSFFSTDLLQVDLQQWLGSVPNALNAANVPSHAAAIATGAINNDTLNELSGLKPANVGICTGGAAGSITLGGGASSVTDFYKGMTIFLTSGTGSGQARLCTAYNGTSKVATVEPNWATTPVNASTMHTVLPHVLPLSMATGGIVAASFGSGAIDAAAIASDAITSAKIADGAIDAGALASDTITAAKIAADAITAAKVADGTIDAATFAAGAINAAALAADAITDAKVAADMDQYSAKVWVIKESTTTDHYAVAFYKNGQRVTAGITSPTIQVIKGSDGTDLIASTALTEIGSTHRFKFDESTNKLAAGQVYFAVVAGTIDGSSRSWDQQIGRDS